MISGSERLYTALDRVCLATIDRGGERLMGISSSDLEILIRLKEAGHLPGRPEIIEIGAQQLANSFLEARESIDRFATLCGVTQPNPLPGPNPTHIVHGQLEHLDQEAPRSHIFWTWLGFEYASVDIDGSPGSIPLDLNYDPAPADAIGKYQLVTNFGTTEHIANQLNAFKVIHDLTKLGGIMMHTLPAQGMANHGLVNYNPKFFWMLARSNGYTWLHMEYSGSQTSYDLPDNIIDHAKLFRPDITARLGAHRISDGGITVAVQKVYDTEFVAPLDVPTGMPTDNQTLQERYWTVFKANAFDELPRWQSVPDSVPPPAAKRPGIARRWFGRSGT
jgi:hypothetical protein